MPIKDYSTTPANNTALFPEGMDAAAVNNGMRQVQADIRAYYNEPLWRDLGHVVTRTSNTTFTISGDVSSQYIVNQRIRCSDSTTLYGTITACAYALSITTVTVVLDSGALSASLTAVAVGFSPDGKPIHASAITGFDNPTFQSINSGNLNLTSTVAPTTGLALQSTGNLGIYTGGQIRARINSGGVWTIGSLNASQSIPTASTSIFQVSGQTSATASILNIAAANNSTTVPSLNLAKTRNTSGTAATAVQNGDGLGLLSWFGADGAGYIEGARISAVVAAAPGTNDMPTDLIFSVTEDGTASPTEALRIGNGGAITFGGASAATGYTGRGDITLPSGRRVYADNTDKAMVYFNGSTLAIARSQNVSSVASVATGRFNVNFTTALPNANYTVVGSMADSGTSVVHAYSSARASTPAVWTTTQAQIYVGYHSGDSTVPANATDIHARFM